MNHLFSSQQSQELLHLDYISQTLQNLATGVTNHLSTGAFNTKITKRWNSRGWGLSNLGLVVQFCSCALFTVSQNLKPKSFVTGPFTGFGMSPWLLGRFSRYPPLQNSLLNMLHNFPEVCTPQKWITDGCTPPENYL